MAPLVTCTNAGGGSASTASPGSFTTVYCSAGSSASLVDEYISNVTVNTINNTSATAPASPYYTNFTAVSTTVTQSSTYAISVTNGGGKYSTDQCVVYVDWNQNGVFTDAGESFTLTQTGTTGLFTGSVIVPAGATIGSCRMRVRLMYTGTPSSCGNATYGEVEDYTLNVTAASCVVPSALSATSVDITTATIDWDAPTSGPTPTDYQIFYSTSSTAPVSGTTPTISGITSTDQGLTGLTGGNLYYVWVRSNCGATQSSWVALPTFTTAPANNNCSGAITLTVNSGTTCTSTTTGTTVAATQSQAGCTGTADDDVWYSFVATATTHAVTVTPGTLTNAVLEIYSSTASCTLSTLLACVNATTGAAAETTTLSSLSIGATYYVKVHSNANGSNQGTFTICVTSPPPPPSNDACTGAIDITCSSSTGNNTNAADETLVASTCGGTGTTASYKGVWFSITPTTSGLITVSTCTGTTWDTYLRAYSGSCGTLTCVSNTLGVGYDDDACTESYGLSSMSFTANTGTTYYILLTGYDAADFGAYTITATCPTTGVGDDECIGATSLTPGDPGAACSPTAGSTLTGYTESAYGCLDGYPDDDIWYSFVATANSHTVIVAGAGNFDAVVAVFSTSDCINFTDVTGGDCTDGPGNGGTETLTLTGLTINSTYYVNVYDWWDNSFGNNSGGDFTICVTTPGPPPNDNCSGAISLIPSAPGVACSPTAGTTVGGTDSGVGCDDGNEDDDVWYSFIATATSHVVTVDAGPGFRTVIGVSNNSSCSSTFTTVPGGSCVNVSQANKDTSLILTSLSVGATYYIKLHDRSAGGATFTICVTTPDNICPDGPPLNDEPCNAVEVTLGSIASGNNACATTSNEPAVVPSCWTTGTRNTVWYSFLAPASGSVKIRTAPGTLVNTQIAAYSGTCGSGLTQIASACNNDAPNCGGTTLTISELTLTGLSNGVRYYVSVDGTNNSVGSFAITIVNGSAAYPTSSGQECSVPITVCNTEINVGNPGYQGIGFTCDANSSIVNCTTGERGSAWYKIDISANGTLLFDIIPNDYDGTYGTETDYDFVLWKVTGSVSTTCAAINSSGGDNEIACNFSADGVTGLSTDGNAPSEYPSFSSAYETGITVIAGESYLLAVQNFSNSLSGFTLDFKNTALGVINTSTPSSVTWTGGNNSSIWDNTVNWGGCTTPTCGINGIVSPSSAFQPTVTAAMGTVNVRNLTIDPGATLTLGPNAVIQICENLTNNGTIIAHPTSTILFNDNTNTHSINGTLSGSSSLGNLTITDVAGSNNCTVVANTDIEITGNFTTTNATSIFNLNGNNLSLNGNFSNAAGATTFTNTANSTIFFNGTAAQTYSPNTVAASPTLTLNNVVMNNSGAGVTISTTNTPNMILGTAGTLTLTAGKIVTPGNQEVTVTNTATTAVSAGNTSSYIEGNLRRNLASGALGSFDFPVGNAALGYQRANINFTSPAAAVPMNLLAKFNSWGGAWPLPGAPGWGPECFVYYNIEYLDNGYWTIDASETSTGTYNASLYNRGFTNAGAASGWSIAKSPTSGPNWALNGLCAPTPSPTPVIRTGMTGFSNFSTIQSASPLPVEMASFNVVCDNGNGLISWSTVSELNSKEFQIERSKDGITYQMLGTVTAAGNSNSLKYYTYSDNDILSGKSYYRLKIVDLDQTFKYTVVNELNCEETTSELSVHYSGETGIVIKSQLSSSTDLEIEIFDILGKKINFTSKRINSGISVTFLNTDGILSDGVYLISIYNTNGSNILTKKVVVK